MQSIQIMQITPNLEEWFMIQVRKFDYNELNVILDQVFFWKEDLIAADTSQFDYTDLLEELSVAECYADKKDNKQFQKNVKIESKHMLLYCH